MKNKKAHQRDQLIMEFGILIQPYAELDKNPNPPTANDYRKAVAKVQGGVDALLSNFKKFTTFASDISFNNEYIQFYKFINSTQSNITQMAETANISIPLEKTHQNFKEYYTVTIDNFKKHLNKIPIEWKSEIFDANTPFTAYLRIREVLAVINERFDYFDRYLKEDFFILFLKLLNRDIPVRLVTTQGKCQGNNQYGVKAVTSISKLAFKQFTDYQLVEVDKKILHDRFLRVDDKIFNLGPGTEGAGIALTHFGPSDDSPETHQKFNDIILQGKKVH